MKKFFAQHECNKYCEGMKKPEGMPVNLLEQPEVKGEGNSTRTMEIAKADKEMLKGIGADSEKFKKIFKVLKVFNISS